LKRQVEQITALAGEDKKAGIRVADALRKRKLRASLKDVKIREPADVQRRLANSADIYSFLTCYFPDVFWGDWTDQRREMVAAILNAARYGGDQAIAAPRGEGKTSIVLTCGTDVNLNGLHVETRAQHDATPLGCCRTARLRLVLSL
jgi:hypothetical protein